MSQAIKFITFAIKGRVSSQPFSQNSNLMRYKIDSAAILEVVIEGSTGSQATYIFKLKEGDLAFVHNDVIHIPVRCLEKTDGNSIRCGDADMVEG